MRFVRTFLLLLALLLHQRDAKAEAFDVSSSDWEGCGDFVRLAREELGDARIVPTSRLDLADLKREDGIILLHPEKTLDSASLARFMKAGGRVILLDDFGSGDGLLEHFGMERVPVPAHPAEALRNNPQLAIASPAGPHPVVVDITRVVTNHATGLKHPDLSPVLKIKAADGEPDVLIAVAGAVGQGRLLAVGDPSIVINAMLRYPGNRTFARAIVRYAGDDDVWGKRTGRIFIVNGNFEQKGSYGDESTLATEWGERVRAFEDALAATRSEGVSSSLAYTYQATADSDGQSLYSSCDYAVEGEEPRVAFWTLAVFDEAGQLIPNPAERYAFNSASVMRPANGGIDIRLARNARPGNWLPTGGAGRISLVFTLEEPRATGTDESRSPPLPSIRRIACR